MKLFVLFLAYILIFVSCGNRNSDKDKSISLDSAAPARTPTPRVTVTDTEKQDHAQVSTKKVPLQTDDTVRFMIAFISKGSGIDNKQKANLDFWLAKKNVPYSISPWGREGEMNYCFPLSNMATGDQQSFIREAKSQITKRDLVYFYENEPCSK